MRLRDRQIRQLVNRCYVTGRVVGSVGLPTAGYAYGVGNTGSSVVGDGDCDGYHRIARACSKSIAARAGQCAEHTGPACTADVCGGEPCRQGVGDGDNAAGGSKAGGGGRDRISSTDLTLSEITAVRLGNGQVSQLVNGRRVGRRV